MALQYDKVKAQSGRTPEAIAAEANRLVPLTPQAPASTVATKPIAADTLGQSQAIKLPTPSLDTSVANGVVAGGEQASKSIQDYVKELTPPETETSKQYGDLLSQINTLVPGLANKSSDQLKAEQQQNLPKLKQDLAALNAQILQRTAQYNKQFTSAETAPGETPLPIVRGRQAVILRNEAADVGLLQARALGLQGQVEAAQETANRAIDLKYDTLEDQLNVKLKQLELIQPLLNKEEERYAKAWETKYNEEREKIKEEKAKAKENMALALESGLSTKFVNKFGEFFRTSDGKPYDNPDEFFADAGVSSFEEAYSKGLIGDFNPDLMVNRSLVADMIAKYPDAGINMGDTLDSAQSKLGNSRIYREQVRPPATGDGGGLTPGQILGFQNQLQDNLRVDPAVKAFGDLVAFGVPEVIDSFNSGTVSNISDTVLMRTLAKVTDPSTGVREEEYRTFEDAVGALGRVYTAPKKWIGRGRLTNEGRNQMIQEIASRYNARLTDYSSAYQYYSGQAQQIPGVSIPPLYTNTQQATIQSQSQSSEGQPQTGFWGKVGNFLFGN